VLKNEDIAPRLGKKIKVTDEDIKEIINRLAEREYIKLKYSEEGTYCLTMLSKGKLFNESEKERKYHLREEEIRNLKFLFKVSFLSGLFAFLGAVTGVIVTLFVINNYILR
jgi:hypothetical protein